MSSFDRFEDQFFQQRWPAKQVFPSGKRVKVMRSDNGGEYIDSAFEKWLREHGITHQTIPARSPQCNGVCERMNRTIQDRARSMLVGAGLGGGLRQLLQLATSGTGVPWLVSARRLMSCGVGRCRV